VDKNIRKLETALADKNVTVSLSDKAKAWIVEKAVAEKAGGRPVERLVNEQITEKISEMLIDGDIDEIKGGTVEVNLSDDKKSLVTTFRETDRCLPRATKK
jgi:ATP-dependent Clp protease ATP-binding subunit ClpA